jgi:hypothetical protein
MTTSRPSLVSLVAAFITALAFVAVGWLFPGSFGVHGGSVMLFFVGLPAQMILEGTSPLVGFKTQLLVFVATNTLMWWPCWYLVALFWRERQRSKQDDRARAASRSSAKSK